MHELAIVILTLDEEVNIAKAVESVGGLAPVFVLDCGSSDHTVSIATAHGAEVLFHPFTSYCAQRNYAIEILRQRYRWIFFLDADEEMTPDLAQEISSTVLRDDIDGAYVRYSLVMLGHELRHGALRGAAVLRLIRAHAARFERSINERIDDRALRTTVLRHEFRHRDAKGLSQWFSKHIRYAQRESEEFLKNKQHRLDWRIDSWKTKAGRVAFARDVYDRLPLLARPLLNFARVMLWGQAWRDGIPGVMYAVMQGLWYPMMVDLFIYEKHQQSSN